MDESDDLRFTVDQTAAVNTALRVTLGLPPQNFTAREFVGMISDEIEQLRAAGWDDVAIAGLIREASGEPLTAEAVTDFYVGPEHRHPE